MSYNKNYNTRNSGRFNTTGTFVPADNTPTQPIPSYTTAQPNNYSNLQAAPPLPPLPMRAKQQKNQQQNHYETFPNEQQYESIESTDVAMKSEEDQPDAGDKKPHWMKNKLDGVKKISNRERRRRQNKHLRKLLSPKNALMTLNELLPGAQVLNNMTVAEAGTTGHYFGTGGKTNFMAEVTLHGNVYKGYGESKNGARNTAAEQAIKDLLIKKLTATSQPPPQTATQGQGDGAGDVQEEEPFPMLQLASFALHKLFSEWHQGGMPVPPLKPAGSVNSLAEATPKAPKVKVHSVPVNAHQLHPATLLSYMRAGLEYRDLGVEGCNPPNVSYTVGVDLDGTTYIGKAGSKKEARRLAAKSACEALFGVTFDSAPSSNIPVPPTQ